MSATDITSRLHYAATTLRIKPNSKKLIRDAAVEIQTLRIVNEELQQIIATMEEDRLHAERRGETA